MLFAFFETIFTFTLLFLFRQTKNRLTQKVKNQKATKSSRLTMGIERLIFQQKQFLTNFEKTI
ncbi:hypothetical protein B6D60_01285 [candidate division KSB1 bacterium 4484_87]|nr:MAG: hypothetical protein B6D60_01285 [candidate division KSB1 bacterium 4484_87]